MYDGCEDFGLDGETFREYLYEYVHVNHYNDETDNDEEEWQLPPYEIVKKYSKN